MPKRKRQNIKSVNRVLGRANPYPSLPPGGAPGDVLAKTHYEDGEADWAPGEQNPYKHRPIPLGNLLSAYASGSDWGLDRNEIGYFSCGRYPFHSGSFNNSAYGDNRWRTWLDPDTDIAEYIRELGDDLVGSTVVAYPTHKSGSWLYGGPERGRIERVSLANVKDPTGKNDLLQITFFVHDESSARKWTKPDAHAFGSRPFQDAYYENGPHYSASYWTDYENGDPKENLLWFIERQTDVMTREDMGSWYKVFKHSQHAVVAGSGDSFLNWDGTSYNANLFRWRCKVGGSNGTYGYFTLCVNPYATGTSLYCPTGSKFDFVWANAGKTEFYDGSIKVNGSSVHRAADLLTVVKASRNAEDFREKLIAHLEEIVRRDEAEAKAQAALEENPLDPEEAEGAPKPKRTRRKKADE